MNNSLVVIGRVDRNPEATHFPSGKKVVEFSLGVKEFGPPGQEAKTMWIDIKAWNGMGDRVLAAVTKGREVALQGRLAIEKYRKDVNGVTVEIVKPVLRLASFHLCGARPKPAGASEDDPTTPTLPELAAG